MKSFLFNLLGVPINSQELEPEQPAELVASMDGSEMIEIATMETRGTQTPTVQPVISESVRRMN